ncbi:MAG: SH3 domain-containing protein [Prolixibacteraceae bacterium]|jgi:hypothetical protein|nr:SH3 domain-containing protein [Prolixibacteraceae bacterium]
MIAFTNIFDSNTWATLSVISFIVCLLFALGFVFLRAVNLKKISFALGIVMLLFSISSFVFASNQKEKLTNHNHAIVFSPSVTVKAEPNKSSVDLFVIHEGLKVEILKVVNSWMEIKLEDGNRGWIHSDELKII